MVTATHSHTHSARSHVLAQIASEALVPTLESMYILGLQMMLNVDGLDKRASQPLQAQYKGKSFKKLQSWSLVKAGGRAACLATGCLKHIVDPHYVCQPLHKPNIGKAVYGRSTSESSANQVFATVQMAGAASCCSHNPVPSVCCKGCLGACL